MCSLSQEQSILSRETIQNAFSFSELWFFFDFDFLSSIKQPTAEHQHMHGVLWIFFPMMFSRALPFRNVLTCFFFPMQLIHYHTTNFSDLSKLKILADTKLDMALNSNCVFGRVENIVGKRENTSYQDCVIMIQCVPMNIFHR